MKAAPLLAVLVLVTACGEIRRTGAECVMIPDAWREPESGIKETDVPMDAIWLGGDEIRWNGRRITQAQLSGFLAQAGETELYGGIRLRIDPSADCTTVRAVVDIMKNARICRDRELCATPERWPDPPPPPDE